MGRTRRRSIIRFGIDSLLTHMPLNFLNDMRLAVCTLRILSESNVVLKESKAWLPTIARGTSRAVLGKVFSAGARGFADPGWCVVTHELAEEGEAGADDD